jgi:hypothetical protein
MPEHLSARVEIALAVEARQRLASEPATEAGRRELPARSARFGRSRRGPERVGWRLPGLSVAATRALATAGAIALIGGGGYEIASHSGVGTTTASSPSARSNTSLPAAAASQAVGAPVNYGHGADARSIPTVTSSTDFEPQTLVAQVVAALDAAQRFDNVHAGPPVHSPLATSSATSSSGLGSFAKAHVLTGLNLGSCLGRFAGAGRIVQLVENARFRNMPATIIVTSAASGRAAEVWVVGESCSASHADVLDHVKVTHI